MPDTIDHAPVPDVGLLAPNVKAVAPHVAAPVWSAPAFAVVGNAGEDTAIVKVVVAG